MAQNEARSPDSRITEEAASWFLRIQEGFSQSDFREWRQWLAENDAHAAAFDSVSIFWRAADQLDDLPWPGEPSLANDAYDGEAALTVPVISQRRKVVRNRNRRSWLGAAAAVVAASLIGLSFLQKTNEDARTYQTVTAQHQTISLQDGSTITLGAQSSVIVSYDDKTRHVALREGEAYFKVAKDSSRPFVVSARSRTVRALGTEFGVNIGVRDIRVSVVEGTVRVEGPPLAAADHGSVEGARNVSNLGAGDVLDFNASGSVRVVSRVHAGLATSWLDGRLEYVEASLESVIADVNRYSETEIIIADQATRRLLYTGTIFSDDIDNWLNGLEIGFPLRLVRVEGHGILLIQDRR